jgi:hypothetical protein
MSSDIRQLIRMTLSDADRCHPPIRTYESHVSDVTPPASIRAAEMRFWCHPTHVMCRATRPNFRKHVTFLSSACTYPPPCMRRQPFEYRHVATGTCHDLGCMYASRRAECGLFLCRNPVRGSSDLARVCRRVGMEGSAPPEGGLESPVNTTLPPESGGVGTQPNTFNDTPGNTTHGTLHHAGGAAGSATSISQAAFSQSDSLAGINSNPQAARSIVARPLLNQSTPLLH